MSKSIVGLAMAFVMALAAPAMAHVAPGDAVSKKSYTFTFGPGGGSNATPCAFVCSYWVDNGFTPCEAPFPIGPGFESIATSYLTQTTLSVSSIPAGQVAVLEATLDVQVDWDSFLCMNTAAATELAQGANILGQPCDNLLGANNLVPVGCHEDMSTPVAAGQTVKFRVYNFHDVSSAIGKSWIVLI